MPEGRAAALDPRLRAWAAYYAAPACRLWLPPSPQFRQFKVRDVRGRWRLLPRKVRTAHQLQRLLVQVQAVDVYYSTSWWLNPHKLVPAPRRGTWMVADRCLLGSDLVFDFDADAPITEAGVEQARRNAVGVLRLMRAHPSYRFQYAAWTGAKGFRLAYRDGGLRLPGPARHRVEAVRARRKALIGALRTAWLQTGPGPAGQAAWPIFDEVVTTDPMRIIRVPGSVHRATGLRSVPISRHALTYAPLASFRHPVPIRGPLGPESPVPGAMTAKRTPPTRRPHFRLVSPAGDVAGPASPAFFVTNNVLGTRGGYVPLLRYQAGRPYTKILKHLQRTYQLGPAYVFQTSTGIAVVFLKVVQRRLLRKLLADSAADNQHSTGRYKMSWLPMPAMFLAMHPGPLTGHLSLAHALHVQPYAPVPEAPMSGRPELKLIKATPKPSP